MINYILKSIKVTNFMKLSSFIIIIFLISSSVAQTPVKFSNPFLYKQESAIEDKTESISSARYILFSLILPGAGQWAMGYQNRAKFFFGAEFLIWVGYIGSNAHANISKNNYQSFATLHAEVISKNKSEQYWIDIGNSENIYKFNEQRLRLRDIKGTYPETDDYFWQWDSKENIKSYNSLRVKEHNWQDRATFMIGAFILNRLVSVIDMIRLIRKEKKESHSKMSKLYFDYKTQQTGSGIFRLNFKIKW